MSNQKYSQVTDLLVQGRLRWATDAISAMLYSGATFDAAAKRASELGVRPIVTVPILGRTVGEGGAALGFPATFQQASPDIDYQVVVGLDDGTHDLLLLAFIDANEADETLTVQRPGSLIVRPVEAVTVVIDSKSVSLPPTMGMWMRL